MNTKIEFLSATNYSADPQVDTEMKVVILSFSVDGIFKNAYLNTADHGVLIELPNQKAVSLKGGDVLVMDGEEVKSSPAPYELRFFNHFPSGLLIVVGRYKGKILVNLINFSHQLQTYNASGVKFELEPFKGFSHF